MVRRSDWNRRPTRSGTEWTIDEEQDLRDLAASGVDPQLIARVFHRKERAVRAFAKKKGITLLTEAEARRRRKKNQRS